MASEELLALLDEYEGCGPGPDAEYVREAGTVTREDGSRFEAWLYAYARPTDGLPRIASGDFFEHLHRKG